MQTNRTRSRKSDVPWEPVYRYAGDMRDTGALDRWIAHLPRPGSPPPRRIVHDITMPRGGNGSGD